MKSIKFNLGNVTAIAACLAVTVMCASCTKKSSNNDVYDIIGYNIEGFENVTEIKAYVAETQWSNQIIAEASLTNNGFTLRLPSVLQANLLVPVVNENMQDVTVSDPSANWAFLGLEVASISNSLYHILSLDDSHTQPDGTATKEAVYIYADRPVELSGNATWIHQQPAYSSLIYPYETEISCTYDNFILSSGWNIVCRERTFETISDDLRRVYNTYSDKNTSDYKWRLIEYDLSGH